MCKLWRAFRLLLCWYHETDMKTRQKPIIMHSLSGLRSLFLQNSALEPVWIWNLCTILGLLSCKISSTYFHTGFLTASVPYWKSMDMRIDSSWSAARSFSSDSRRFKLFSTQFESALCLQMFFWSVMERHQTCAAESEHWPWITRWRDYKGRRDLNKE